MSWFPFFNKRDQVPKDKKKLLDKLLEEEEKELEGISEDSINNEELKKDASERDPEDNREYEIVEKEILPAKIICPDCGGITLEGLDFCDKCGGELY